MRTLVAAMLVLGGCGSAPTPVTDLQRCMARFDPCGTSAPDGATLSIEPVQRAKQIVFICLGEAWTNHEYDLACGLVRDNAGHAASVLTDACDGMAVPFECCDALTAAARQECTPGAVTSAH